jgi:azurin
MMQDPVRDWVQTRAQFRTQYKRVAIALVALCAAWITAPSIAADCSVTVESDDAMRFTPAQIEVPKTCETFTVKLIHTGRLPKLAMGHNWVLVKQTDLDGVARTSMAAGEALNYIDSTDARVIAHTALIGTGESASVSFPVKKLQAGVRYSFLCTFAGHSPIMQGTLALAR